MTVESSMKLQGNFWADLERRHLVHDSTGNIGPWLSEELLRASAAGEKTYAYAGFDPTAESLHVGSLMPVLNLLRLKQAGVTPIVLVGGATGMIGDPSGKSSERSLLDRAALERNVAGIARQLAKYFDGEPGRDFVVVDNASWMAPMALLDFLRDVGKHFSVNAMVRKDSVRSRLDERDQGISYTEFSYMLLQAYDYLHLFEKYGCRLQTGGSDQWGNITAGIDLIHRKHHGAVAHGWTCPLLTRSDGKKFGKSETGNLWLDPQRTHPYFVYKYFFDTPDADVVKLLQTLTMVDWPELAALEESLRTRPQDRLAQARLALEATTLVHDSSTATACAGLESAMHHDDIESFEAHAAALGLLDPATLAGGEHDVAMAPVLHRPRSALAGDGLAVIDLAVDCGLFASKSEVRRELQSGGGLRLAGAPVQDPNLRLTTDWLGARKVVQLRKGKKNKRMICFFD